MNMKIGLWITIVDKAGGKDEGRKEGYNMGAKPPAQKPMDDSPFD